MKIRNILSGLTVVSLCTMGILAISDTQTVKAESNPSAALAPCSSVVAGTYLTTILNADRTLASRGLITLTRDGNIIVGDSNQGGISGVFNAFTTSQGSWVCTGKRSITARSLNFSIANKGGTGIARSNYVATVNPNTKTVRGTITLNLFGLQDNPLVGNGTK